MAAPCEICFAGEIRLAAGIGACSRQFIMGTGEARPQHFIEDEIFHVLHSKTFRPAQQDFTAEGDFTSEFVSDKLRVVRLSSQLIYNSEDSCSFFRSILNPVRSCPHILKAEPYMRRRAIAVGYVRNTKNDPKNICFFAEEKHRMLCRNPLRYTIPKNLSFTNG